MSMYAQLTGEAGAQDRRRDLQTESIRNRHQVQGGDDHILLDCNHQISSVRAKMQSRLTNTLPGDPCDFWLGSSVQSPLKLPYRYHSLCHTSPHLQLDKHRKFRKCPR